jgi:hypothetical protein
MKKYLLSLLLLLFTANIVFSQALLQATGTVFHDLNANGIRDEGEPGIAGVAVASRSALVLTDSRGTYSLPLMSEDEVFVIKPSEYNYPLNEYNLPQFYYLHKHNRPPLLKYRGIERTEPLPESIDFSLLSGSYEEEFSVVVMSDPQTYTIEQVGFYEKGIVKELVGSQQYAFGITLGDIVGDDLDLFGPINKATAKIGIPWFHVAGNHDINQDAPDMYYNDERFKMVYGPSTYAFNHGKVHFVVLNNIIFPNAFTDHHYVGGIRDEQFVFISKSIELVPEDHLIVLCMHIPLYNEELYGETFLNLHRQRLFDILKEREFTLSMSGHTHSLRHYHFNVEHGWHQETPHHHYTTGTASGDWWSGEIQDNGAPDATMYDGTPKGYSILHFSGNQYTIDYKAAGSEKDYKMRLYGPKRVPQGLRYRGELYVNFFQGSEKDLVEYRVNDGSWRPMRYTIEPDPFLYARLYEWDMAVNIPNGTRPSNPLNSYHLWKTRIPANLPAGTNFIHVKVTDTFGRVFTEKWEFEVVEVK